MNNSQKFALKISVVLWIIWGLVHMLAGGLTIFKDPSSGFAGIADAIEPSLFVAEYQPAVGGILNQHGWNLLWIGLVTLVGAVYIWRGNMTAIWVTGLVGGLADLGYFLFMDIPGYVNFVPGTVMTLFSGTAIILGFWVWFAKRNT